MIDIALDLPCTVLAQRLDLEIEEVFSAKDDFANVFSVERVLYEGANGTWKPSILIKKPGETGDKGEGKVLM
jgi:hypothetical protein